MKKIVQLISIGTMLVFTYSCDILNQEPEALISSSDAISDSRSAESALNGVYHLVQSGDLYGGRFILANEMLAENATASAFQAFWAELDNGNVPASNFHLEDLWTNSYAAINASNALIAAVPGISPIDEDDADRILGSAYFFRALLHFDLLRQFGEFFDAQSSFGIPYITSPSSEPRETPRSTVGDSYRLIKEDLREALSRLPDQGNKFFVSLGAAQALQARVALYESDYTTAISAANAVLGNSFYLLEEDYNLVHTTEGSGESIFELNFVQLADPNVWSIELYTAPPEVSVSSELISFFSAQGETERASLYEQSGLLTRCTKYGTTPEQDGENTILFRLSEMHLIRAEALAMQSGGAPVDALPDINAVRTRAGQPQLLGFANQQAFVDALLAERRAEFAFEGHYWFDLIRLGRMEEATGRASFRRVMPIPFREINITDGTLVQNPGYE